MRALLRAGLFAALLCSACDAELATQQALARGGKADDGSAILAGTKIRIVASNLTSGEFQNYDGGEGLRILQGVRPDVVLVQEFNVADNSPEALEGFTRSVLGADGFYYHQNIPAEVEHAIPNGVVSRYPIVDSGDWEDSVASTREYAWARIDVPGPRDLWAVSVHLFTNKHMRPTEATELVANIRDHIPADDLLVLGGDFNTKSRGETCVQTLSEVLVTAGPYPRDASSEKTNAKRNEPFDWVLANPSLQARAVPTQIGASVFDAGFVADTRRHQPLSDLAPALETDSAALNMQHMAVVRDFVLEGEEQDVPQADPVDAGL